MTDSQGEIEQDKEQLRRLEQDIDEVRRETATDPRQRGEKLYVDSGTVGDEQDDQTITPPG